MKPSDFEYVQPATISEAIASLQASGDEGKVLAGGQSLVPLMNFRLAAPRILVDINRTAGLAHVTRDAGRLRVGAMTRLRSLETDPIVRQTHPVLAAAAAWVGHIQIRNRGTVGGSLSHADPAAEIPAIAVLTDAELVVAGPNGDRVIPAADFFLGFLVTALAADEILTEIRFSAIDPADGWGFREFAHRRGDFALAGAAATLHRTDGVVDRARCVVFGTNDRPVRVASAEAALVGGPVSQERLAAAARLAAGEALADDPRPDAPYRRTVTETMVRRSLEDAAARQVLA
jgi:carbon-monoxide dehydrogenase medium subunit